MIIIIIIIGGPYWLASSIRNTYRENKRRRGRDSPPKRDETSVACSDFKKVTTEGGGNQTQFQRTNKQFKRRQFVRVTVHLHMHIIRISATCIGLSIRAIHKTVCVRIGKFTFLQSSHIVI